MKFLENTKLMFGQRAIRNNLKGVKRIVTSRNINNAKSIGILFNATHQVSFEIVKALVKDLSKKKIAIEVLGYVDSKQLIDHYLYRKGFNFFTRNHLNWYYKPSSEYVEPFIKKPFDILLDLSLDNPFPIQYIVACSKAKFKTGKFSSDNLSLDFMIDIEKENETISSIQNELEKDRQKAQKKNHEVEMIVDKKVKTEIQMNFLINQLLHYLSILKK